MALHRLTKIIVGVPDVEAAIPFYADFGLDHRGGGRFATSAGGEQLALAHRPRRGLVELGVGCDDPDDIDAIISRLAGLGIDYRRDGQHLLVDDAGSGIRVRVEVASRYDQEPVPVPAVNSPGIDARTDARAPAATRTAPVQPRKLGHVVVGSTGLESSERLFLDVLGFQVSDTIRHVGKFMRCSTDHHNLMVSKAPAHFLHHTSWQVDDVDEVGRGGSDMIARDPERHAWGLGRHNVGSNFFWYLRDPAGNYVEYYSDLDVITDDGRWEAGLWGARDSIAAWGPPHPKTFFAPDAPADVLLGT